MLTTLTRLLRPAPPSPIPVEAPHPMPLTTCAYRAAVRRRAAESRAERRAIIGQLAHVQAVRARIQTIKREMSERESIRSSLWTKEKEKA